MKILGAQLDLVSKKIVNLADPSSNTDAANKQYVDNLISGLKWKPSVRAATTTNGTLASAYANGSSIDGVTLATNDEILIKNQSSGAENGVYVVNATGAPTRRVDYDQSAELLQAVVMAREGTTNADTAWVLTNNTAPTVNTTALVYAQFGGGAVYTAGNGISVSSNVITAVATTGITVTGSGIGIDTSVVVRKYASSMGDGSTTVFTKAHGLGTADLDITIYTVSGGEVVYPDITVDSTNVVVTFAVAPSTNQYRLVAQG